MKMQTYLQFQCTHCGNLIPWSLTKADLGLTDTEEPADGKVYPYDKCVCGKGKFIQCINKKTQLITKKTSFVSQSIKDKINNAVYKKLPIVLIHPNPKQPRRFFDKKALHSLAESINSFGLLEDIMVRKATSSESYEIVMGERRWRASLMAGLTEISCKIVSLTDEEVKIISLIENLQRENLTEVEEAFSFKEFTDRGYAVHELGDILGKFTERVAGKLKLLSTQQFIKFQEERINELIKDNENLKAGLVSLQEKRGKKFESKILHSKTELLNFINEGWEFVALIGKKEFLVRREII